MEADAVVLAGGSSKDLADAPAKGVVDLNGRPMVEYILDALRECPEIARICVVVPHGVKGEWQAKADVVVESSGSLTENAIAGISAVKSDKMIALLSSDIPLLTPQALSDFLARCETKNARLFYPIIPESTAKAFFPSMKRTYVKMKQGSFTGGNIVLADPSIVETHLDLIEEAYALRKSPVKLARRLGVKFIIGLLLGNLSIGEAEKRVARLLDSPVSAIETPFAEIGLDVDKISDLQIISAYLAGNHQ